MICSLPEIKWSYSDKKQRISGKTSGLYLFWYIQTRQRQTTLLWCESPVPSHPKGALLNWETLELIWVQWTHCHFQETRLRWSGPCYMVHYLTVNFDWCSVVMVWTSLTAMLRCWNDAQLVVRGPKCTNILTPTPAGWNVDTRPDG